LFGGTLPTNVIVNDTATFDGASWTQLSIASQPPVRDSHAMATLGGKVVLFAGYGSVGSTAPNYNDTWEFDGASWTQVSIANPPPAPPRGRFIAQRSTAVPRSRCRTARTDELRRRSHRANPAPGVAAQRSRCGP
jgi:hypothetical protein